MSNIYIYDKSAKPPKPYNGNDCPCCGDRWYRVDESDGSDVPSIYGTPLENAQKSFFRDKCFVHYLNGTFKKIELK